MKKVLILLSLVPTILFAQGITGDWSGGISINGMSLGFGMHISLEDGQYQSVMDIPAQNAMGIKMTSTTYVDEVLVIESKEMAGVFTGKFVDEKIAGNFSQNGQVLPFTMERGEAETMEIRRPQNPIAPFEYTEHEVSFKNTMDNVELSGTLTMPKGKGPFPAVVLVSGSGQQNRDSEIMEHKPFWVIADYLSNSGIAVLRYDDRGAGKSTGVHSEATSANFALDAQAATAFLLGTDGINKKKVGIIGHSEGGMIAPMVAANKKNKIGFVILLAGPAVSGADILLEQQALISEANGESKEDIQGNREMSEALFQFMRENEGDKNMKDKLTTFIKEYFLNHEFNLPDNYSEEQLTELLANAYSSIWMQYFLLHDPKSDILNLTCPVLALNGDKDLQVPAKQNIDKFNAYALESGNKHFQTKIFPDLNHLFQHADTGAPSEYVEIEETFSPEVLLFMKDWINNLKK